MVHFYGNLVGKYTMTIDASWVTMEFNWYFFHCSKVCLHVFVSTTQQTMMVDHWDHWMGYSHGWSVYTGHQLGKYGYN